MAKSINQIEAKNISAISSKLQSISSGISVIRTNQSMSSEKPNSSNNNLWNQFEQFKKWKESSSAPVSDDDIPVILEETGPSGKATTLISRPKTPPCNPSLKWPSPSPFISITKTSSAPAAESKTSSAPVAESKTSSPPAAESKTSSAPVAESKTRKVPKTRRAPSKGARTPTSPPIATNQFKDPPNTGDENLKQPLNPTMFQPGALKSRDPVANLIYSNMISARKYPGVSNESVNKLASTFMAAPTPQVLTLMSDDTFPEDFHIKNCKSSSEYLYCLMGFGLHQTLNFPIMGVFYLELVRLILKNMDRFSANENVKLIQVRVICEDILGQNSVRDDFLPVEVMETIVDKVVKEHTNIQHLIEEQESRKNEPNKSDNTCHSKTEEILINNSKKKRNDEVLLIDLDEEDVQSTLDLNSKYSPGYSTSSSSSSSSENKIKISSPSKADCSIEKSSSENGMKRKASEISNEDDEIVELISPESSSSVQRNDGEQLLKRLRNIGVTSYSKSVNPTTLSSHLDTEEEKEDISYIPEIGNFLSMSMSIDEDPEDILILKSPQNAEKSMEKVGETPDDLLMSPKKPNNTVKLNELRNQLFDTNSPVNAVSLTVESNQNNDVEAFSSNKKISDLICDIKSLIDNDEVQPNDNETMMEVGDRFNKDDKPSDTESVSEYLDMFEKTELKSSSTEIKFVKEGISANKSNDKTESKNEGISPQKNKVENKLKDHIRNILRNTDNIDCEKNTDDENRFKGEVGYENKLNRDTEDIENQFCKDCYDFFNTENDFKKHICIGKIKKDNPVPDKSITAKEFDKNELNLDSDSDSEEEEESSRSYNWNDF